MKISEKIALCTAIGVAILIPLVGHTSNSSGSDVTPVRIVVTPTPNPTGTSTPATAPPHVPGYFYGSQVAMK